MRPKCVAADTPKQMRDFPEPSSPSKDAAEQSLTVMDALLDLGVHPVRTFIYSWNWKSALLSVTLRAPVFLVATLRRGFAAMSVAVVVEALYSAAISGCYGAFVQKLRHARPAWAAGLLIVIAMPAVLFWFDYLLHLATAMPNLKGSMAAAGIFSLLSSLFNWFLMSRSSLLVGQEGHSLANDLKRMPRLIVDFLALVPRHCYRFFRSCQMEQQA
jgi:hypothetical protein